VSCAQQSSGEEESPDLGCHDDEGVTTQIAAVPFDCPSKRARVAAGEGFDVPGPRYGNPQAAKTISSPSSRTSSRSLNRSRTGPMYFLTSWSAVMKAEVVTEQHFYLLIRPDPLRNFFNRVRDEAGVPTRGTGPSAAKYRRTILQRNDLPRRGELRKLALWDQREGLHVVGAHGEVPAVDGCNLSYAQSLGRGHDGCVDGAERQVAVPSDEFSDAHPISGSHRLDAEGAVCQVAEEAHFGFRTETGTEQVGHLGDDQRGDDQRPRMRFEELQRWRVVGIVGVDVRIQRPCIDDQRRYRATSAARISSTRSEMSVRPLRPAPAAPRIRRPHGWPK